ncbi:RNA polymerase subunit sigma, partial [Acinetobacter baumannii]
MTSAAASHHDDLGDQLHSPAFLQDLRQQMIKFAFLQLSSL